MADEELDAPRVRAFAKAVETITGTVLPFEMWPGCIWHENHTGEAGDALQNWIGDRMPEWMAAIGIIEAAELLVETAIEVDAAEFLRRFGTSIDWRVR